MRLITLLVLINILLFFHLSVFAQSTDIKELQELESRLDILFDYLLKAGNDNEKDLINSDITKFLEQALHIEESFNYPFDSLKSVGKITSSDKRLRIITWNVPYKNGTHRYSGFIHYKPEKSKTPLIFSLNDKSDEIEKPEQIVLDTGNWYGALYYDIVEVKDQDTKYYTLLGFDFNNFFSSKKIIDVLYFNDFSEPLFGKSIFRFDNRVVARMIFEYSSRASMSLRYHKEMDMIVFDHLSPSRPSYTGKFEFYGPDMSYDAIKFEKGFWVLKKDLDIRN